MSNELVDVQISNKYSNILEAPEVFVFPVLLICKTNVIPSMIDYFQYSNEAI